MNRIIFLIIENPCFSFFSVFSTQNQVPQIIIGMGWVTYHSKAVSEKQVCLNHFQKFQKIPSVEKKPFKILDFSS